MRRLVRLEPQKGHHTKLTPLSLFNVAVCNGLVRATAVCGWRAEVPHLRATVGIDELPGLIKTGDLSVHRSLVSGKGRVVQLSFPRSIYMLKANEGVSGLEGGPQPRLSDLHDVSE